MFRVFTIFDESEEHNQMNHLVVFSNQIDGKKPPSGTNASIKL